MVIVIKEGYNVCNLPSTNTLQAQSTLEYYHTHQVQAFRPASPRTIRSDETASKSLSIHNASIHHGEVLTSFASVSFELSQGDDHTLSMDARNRRATHSSPHVSSIINNSTINILPTILHGLPPTIRFVRNSRCGHGTPSALAQRRKKLKMTYGPSKVTSENRIKGVVSIQSGQILWYDPNQSLWHLFAYHSDYRQQLAQINNAKKRYLIEPAHRWDPYDVASTCGFLRQNEWRFDTFEQLAMIRDEEGNAVFQ